MAAGRLLVTMDQDFDSFCRREYTSVFRAALALSSNREVSEDATQEAFGRAYARWPRLQKEPWVTGWVMTTALNLCRTAARKSGRRLGFGEAALPLSSEPNANRIEVIAALRRLPPRQQQAVILHYIGDLPIRAVAELMDLSDGTVKSYLFRARASLRDLLAEHDHSPTESEINNG